MENEKLRNKIKKHYECFILHHQNASALKCVNPSERDFSSIKSILGLFDKNIAWVKTQEGYLYYYRLNMRWAFSIAYLCHENDASYDKECLGALENYVKYSHSAINETNKKEYLKWKAIYSKKIKKIKEIFGN